MQAVWDEVFPKLKWDISAPLPIGALWLEIGFGGAEHLLWQAEHYPDIHLIGAEPFLNGMAKAVRWRCARSFRGFARWVAVENFCPFPGPMAEGSSS